MRILYGVVGEGMGHATRSRVVLEHLLARGHEVLVAVSGRAFGFLGSAFEGRERISLVEIHGLHMNARYLERLGYGSFVETLSADAIERFLGDLPRHDAALAGYRPRDNGILLACVDELLAAIARGDEGPGHLRAGAALHLPPAGTDAAHA